MQDAVDGAELNGYLRSFKTNQETKKQKMELDEDCARVVAEVKTKNYVLSLNLYVSRDGLSHCTKIIISR